MTTLTVNSTTNSGEVESNNTTYATAASGSNLTTSSTVNQFGQWKSGATFFLFETFLDFDTSSIPGGATISSVTLKLWGSADGSTTDFTAQARLFDYGASLTTADWQSATAFAALPLLATYATSGGWSTSGYNTFSENGTVFRSNINIGGVTRIVLSSDRFAAGTVPTQQETVTAVSHSGTSSEWPTLIVVYSTAVEADLVGAEADGASTATIALRSPHLFVAEADGASTATIGLRSPHLFSATANGASTATVTAVSTPAHLTPTANGVSSATILGVSTTVNLGTFTSTSVSTASVTNIEIPAELGSVTANGVSSAAAVLISPHLFTATANGASSATVGLLSPHLFSATANGASSATATLSAKVLLSVTANGASSATIGLSTPPPPLCPPLDAIVSESRTQAALIHPGPSDAVIVDALNTSALFVSGPNDAIVAPSRTSFIACWKD